MKVTDYVDVINCNIQMTYYHNQNNRWCAKFEYAEVLEHKGSATLVSEHGNGPTPEAALQKYIDGIKGKILVFNATGGDKRREFKVPMNLEA